MRAFQAFVLVACFGGPLLAQLHVPGDFAKLQDAIDASAPGGTIVIHGGTHPSIVIDKPLTLVGESMPVIAATIGMMEIKMPSIRLAGPGSGVVTLVGLRTYAPLLEGLVGFGNPGILGGGFDQLRVLHADIEGAGAVSGSGTELLQGTHAISVTVPYIVVEDSVVEGGATVRAFGGPGLTGGSTGIHAPFSTVTLLDSQVSGGLVHDFGWAEFFYPCPPSCEALVGSDGGTGIVAAQLYRSNSSVTGGAGGTIICLPSFTTCAKPDGPPLQVTLVTDLPNNLLASGPLDQGALFQLSWFSLGNPALLLASPVSIPPVAAGAHGLLFLDVGAATLFAVPGGGIVDASFSVPTASVLLGAGLTLQVYDPVLGLTRPVLAAFVP